MSITHTLAAYLSGVARTPLPADVADRTRLHLLDTLAAMVSGASLDAGRRALDYVRGEGSSDQATVIGGGITATAADAGFANGMAGHADETDDSHPAGFHPGCGIVAAALAMAEREHSSGEVLLRAIAAGYDVGSRAALAALPQAARAAGYSVTTHAIGGTFGAGAAAATQIALTPDQLTHVLSYTAQQAWGARSYLRDAHHVEKAFVYGGRPARAGIMAATMVQRGFDAVPDVFEGEFNYFAAIGFDADPPALVDGLGSRWEIMRTNIKRYPVGSPILGVVEGLNRILSRASIAPEQVQQVTLEMPARSAQVVNERDMPNVNAQHITAIMLLDGALHLAASHDYARMQDPAVLALRQRISLVPGAGDETMVRIALASGEELSERVPSLRRAMPSPADVQQKARELISEVLGASAADALIEQILRIETLADVRQLRPMLQARVAVAA
jgi:2-methylcitrate dehydratase PrpD